MNPVRHGHRVRTVIGWAIFCLCLFTFLVNYHHWSQAISKKFKHVWREDFVPFETAVMEDMKDQIHNSVSEFEEGQTLKRIMVWYK